MRIKMVGLGERQIEPRTSYVVNTYLFGQLVPTSNVE